MRVPPSCRDKGRGWVDAGALCLSPSQPGSSGSTMSRCISSNPTESYCHEDRATVSSFYRICAQVASLFSLLGSLLTELIAFVHRLAALSIHCFACIFIWLAVLSVALRFLQLFAIGGGYCHYFIAFAEVHEAHALRGASRDVDGADIRADDHAAGRDNHQVVIFFGNHAGSGDRAGL